MSLRDLIIEVCAGVEIYYTGRSDGDYFKSAFVLCDDYCELTSKLWLRQNVAGWSENFDTNAQKYALAYAATIQKVKDDGHFSADVVEFLEKDGPRDRFKNYHRILGDVHDAISPTDTTLATTLEPIQIRMKARREKRNSLFHSADFLGFDIRRDEVVRAFCDLFDYGELLFGSDWRKEVNGVRQLETFEMLLRLEQKGANNQRLRERVRKVFQEFPRNDTAKSRGWSVVQADHDLHLRLCVLYGESELKNKLKVLLDNP